MTEQTQPDPTGTVISADDQRAIRVAMNAVPYAADLRVPIPPRGDLSAGDVVAFLDGLREVLTEVAARADDQHRRLLHEIPRVVEVDQSAAARQDPRRQRRNFRSRASCGSRPPGVVSNTTPQRREQPCTQASGPTGSRLARWTT